MNTTSKHQPLIKAITREEFGMIEESLNKLPNIFFEQIIEASFSKLSGLHVVIESKMDKRIVLPNNTRQITGNRVFSKELVIEIKGVYDSIVFVDENGITK